jgi:hypothetical protein
VQAVGVYPKDLAIASLTVSLKLQRRNINIQGLIERRGLPCFSWIFGFQGTRTSDERQNQILEHSLTLGSQTVQGEYDIHFQKSGQRFVAGDGKPWCALVTELMNLSRQWYCRTGPIRTVTIRDQAPASYHYPHVGGKEHIDWFGGSPFAARTSRRLE